MIVIESNQNHAVIKDTEICPALTASMGMGGGYVPMILEHDYIRRSKVLQVAEGRDERVSSGEVSKLWGGE